MIPTYRENIMPRGHTEAITSGARAPETIDDRTSHSFIRPGMIIWSLVVKYVLTVFAIQADMLHIKARSRA